MKTPMEIEMDEKKGKLTNLLYLADENPLIDSNKILELFRFIPTYIEEYKYFPNGYTILETKIISLLSDVYWGPFLNSYVDDLNTIKLYQAILGGLV